MLHNGTNRVKLYTEIDGELVSHFSAHEFANKDGLLILHRGVLTALELLRQRLCIDFDENISIRITDSIRTPEENEELASRLGWIDKGGKVSRDSKHLIKYGGIAVDIVAYRPFGEVVSPKTVGEWARTYFTFVKDDYDDPHLHMDLRDSV